MENILDIVEEPGPDIKESNLIRHIWLHPTACFKFILRNIPGKHVNVLFILGGLANGISRIDDINSGDPLGFWGTLFLTLTGSIIGGFIGFYILSWATHAAGRWLKSEAKLPEIQSIIAWSQVPSIAAGIISLIPLLLIGSELFRYDLEIENLLHSAMLIAFGLAVIILGAWGLFILAKGLAYAGQLSMGKALLNALLPYLILAAAGGLAALVYFTITGGT